MPRLSFFTREKPEVFQDLYENRTDKSISVKRSRSQVPTATFSLPIGASAEAQFKRGKWGIQLVSSIALRSYLPSACFKENTICYGSSICLDWHTDQQGRQCQGGIRIMGSMESGECGFKSWFHHFKQYDLGHSMFLSLHFLIYIIIIKKKKNLTHRLVWSLSNIVWDAWHSIWYIFAQWRSDCRVNNDNVPISRIQIVTNI